MSDEILKLIKDKEVQYVDLRFNDLRGKMQHVTFDVSMIDKDIFTEGTMFDGSSIAGWKAINESDMVMRPDPAGAHIGTIAINLHPSVDCSLLQRLNLSGAIYIRNQHQLTIRIQNTEIIDI